VIFACQDKTAGFQNIYKDCAFMFQAFIIFSPVIQMILIGY